MSLRDDINIPLIVVLGLTTGLIVAVAIIGTQAGYNYATQSELARNYAEAEATGRLHFGQNVFDAQREAMNANPSWADVNKTTVRIPVDAAMQTMIATQGRPPAAPTTSPAGNNGSTNSGGAGQANPAPTGNNAAPQGNRTNANNTGPTTQQIAR